MPARRSSRAGCKPPGRESAGRDKRLPAAVKVIGFGLPRQARMLTRQDFRRVYRHGHRAHGSAMVVVACPRHAPGHRVGLSVSKAHGCAIRRNKIKRLLREAFRLERPKLPGQFDLVLIPKQRPGKYELRELRVEIIKLVRKLHQKRGRRRQEK